MVFVTPPCHQVEWMYEGDTAKLYNFEPYTSDLDCSTYCEHGLSVVGAGIPLGVYIKCTTSGGKVYYSGSTIDLNGESHRVLAYNHGQTTPAVLTSNLEADWTYAIDEVVTSGNMSTWTIPAQNNIPSLIYSEAKTAIGGMTVTYPDGSTGPGGCGEEYMQFPCTIPYKISRKFS